MELTVRSSTPLPTADYRARIRDVETAEGKYGPQLKWVLALGDVTNVDGAIELDKDLWYFTPDTASAKNKLGRLAIAAGYEFGSGRLSTEDIVGRSVMVTLALVTREDGTLANSVTDVRKVTAGTSTSGGMRAAPAGADADLPF